MKVMINELFQQDGQSIFSFKQGDIIIRLKPAELKSKIYNDNLGIHVEVVHAVDNGFREPMEFVAVANNRIYLKWATGYFKGKVVNVELENYAEDWAHFVIPDGLTLDDCGN